MDVSIMTLFLCYILSLLHDLCVSDFAAERTARNHQGKSGGDASR